MDKIDKNYITINECRISNSKDLKKVLDSRFTATS